MRVYKCLMISCAHQLDLPYFSVCNTLHGHNYKIEIWIEGRIDGNGMLFDFVQINDFVKAKYDHKNLNEIFNPTTAECFAKQILDDLTARNGMLSYLVRVWETDTCYAETGSGVLQ